MDKIVRNLAIGLLMLIILAPLGLLAVGETFGEWGPEELQEKLGVVPPGIGAALWTLECTFAGLCLTRWRRFDDRGFGSVHSVRSNRCSSLWWTRVLCRKEDRQRLKFSNNYMIYYKNGPHITHFK